jgi:hypothetical protein
VIWTVFANTGRINLKQMSSFTKLKRYNDTDVFLGNNYRKLQGRQKKSFLKC